MRDRDKQVSPFDPTQASHAFGMELARVLNEHRQPQAQQQRAREVKRELHVISDSEYVLTETTREIELFSFPTDIFNIWRGEA